MSLVAERWELESGGLGWWMISTYDPRERRPISPVFESPEALADWLSETGASAFANMTATREDWLRMILSEEEACSCGTDKDGETVSGVALLARDFRAECGEGQ